MTYIGNIPSGARAQGGPTPTQLNIPSKPINANYTIVGSDQGYAIEVDASQSSIQITLPAFDSVPQGFTVFVKKSDTSTNTVTVIAPLATINGLAQMPIQNQWSGVGIQKSHTQWTTFALSAILPIDDANVPIALGQLIDVDTALAQNGQSLTFDNGVWIPGNPTSIADLDSLSDVSLSNTQTGQTLVFDGAQWTNQTPSLIAQLDDLTDVFIQLPANGETIVFDNGNWVNQAIPSGVTLLSALNDVSLNNLQLNQFLQWNGSNWVNVTAVPNSGESNTASNVGGGSALFKQKTGVDLEFRTLQAGSGITITQQADTVTVAATTSNGPVDYTDLIQVTQNIVTRSSDTNVRSQTFAIDNDVMMRFRQTSTQGHPFSHTWDLYRRADYSGGQSGWVNSALFAFTEVTNPNAQSFEWAITGICRSNATGGENVGVYGQAWGTASNHGPIWAMATEARETVDQQSPGATHGIEIGIFGASGVNTNRNRIGAMIVAGAGDDAWNASETWSGVYVSSRPNKGYYQNAIHVGNDPVTFPNDITTATNAIRIVTNGDHGIWDSGVKQKGIRLTGDYSESAISIEANNLSNTAINANGQIAVTKQNAPMAVDGYQIPNGNQLVNSAVSSNIRDNNNNTNQVNFAHFAQVEKQGGSTRSVAMGGHGLATTNNVQVAGATFNTSIATNTSPARGTLTGCTANALELAVRDFGGPGNTTSGIYMLAIGDQPIGAAIRLQSNTFGNGASAQFVNGIQFLNTPQPIVTGNLMLSENGVCNTGILFKDHQFATAGIHLQNCGSTYGVRANGAMNIGFEADLTSAQAALRVLGSGGSVLKAEASAAYTRGIDFQGVSFIGGFVLRSESLNIENSGLIDFPNATAQSLIETGTKTANGEWLKIKVNGVNRFIQMFV
jgi:hypothetical protein